MYEHHHKLNPLQNIGAEDSGGGESSFESTSNASSVSIYRYTRDSNRNNIFIQPVALRRENTSRQIYGTEDYPLSSLRENVPRESVPSNKKYAILQEAKSEVTNRKIRYMLSVYSTSAWKLFIVSVLIVTYTLDTLIYTFKMYKSNEIVYAAICLNSIFTMDVAIVVCLKIFKKWRKTLNLVEPDAIKVLLDVFVALPFSMLYLIQTETSFEYHAIVPIIAVIRCYRILAYFFAKSLQAGRNQWSTFLFQYLTLLYIAVHAWTCLWYLFAYKGFNLKFIGRSWTLSTTYLPTETTLDWYFTCAYWSVMMLTTNALGDLFPVTMVERVMAIFGIMIGFSLTTMVFVGSLTSQFITITTRRAKYVRQLNSIQKHLKLIKMDEDTTQRIINYYEDLWYQKSGVFKPKFFKLLPYPLQMEICYDLNAVPLSSSLIFRKLPESFLRRLSLVMAHQFYLPGDIVFQHNQDKTLMVCISNGVLELLSDEDDESPMVSLTKGTCFGEISLVFNIPARCTVKAATYVECQVLEKREFIKLMITYPDLHNQIRIEINQRIKRSHKRKHIVENTNTKLNVYASKERKKSSVKLLKDKLRYRQGHRTTEDRSESDYLDENCLDLYIVAEHVKKRSTLFTCIKPSFPWILESDCVLVSYWETYMLCIVFYICITYPYFIGFDRSFPGGVFFYFEILITISMIFNVLMASVTAIKTKKQYITEVSEILQYRMNTLGFYLDIIAIIPVEYFVTLNNESMFLCKYRDHLFYVCKGIKLCLVWRISSFFEKIEKRLLVNAIATKILKYCVYLCLLCYWCGVILYMAACFTPHCSHDSWFANTVRWDHEYSTYGVLPRTDCPYVTSVYFATSILMSVGYGDFVPGDHFDMFLVAFLSMYGVLLVGFCIAEFSAVITHWSRTKTSLLEVIITIDKFMKENNMHSAIKGRIMAFYELQWQYNSGVELTGESWLEQSVAPVKLRKKVLHQARFKALTAVKFFQVQNKEYIQTLTEKARDIILPPGEIVRYGGTVTRDLYIIESGYCQVHYALNDKEKTDRVIGPGSQIGLIVMLYGIPAISSVVTLTHCKLISLDHSAYTSALSLFPDMVEHEGLLRPEEWYDSEINARNYNMDLFKLQHNRKHGVNRKLGLLEALQQIMESSIINVYKDYKLRNESYLDSYKQFHVFNYIAPYLLMPIVIRPDGALIRLWSYLRIMAAFLICLFVPINIALAPLGGVIDTFIIVFDVIFFVDIYIRLHVGVYGAKNQLIYHPYLTAKKYLQGAFALDFLTCFPWHVVWQLFVSRHNEGHQFSDDQALSPHYCHCGLRIISVLQVYKVLVAFWAESNNALKRAYSMNVVQFVLLTLFFLNIYATFLIMRTCRYVLAKDHEDFIMKLTSLNLPQPYINSTFNPLGNMVCTKGSWLDRSSLAKDSRMLTPAKVYLIAFYWAAASFSGAGFGDVTAQDTISMLISMCANIHGCLFFGYVYASIAALKATADQVTTRFHENLKHLELFLNREKAAHKLKRIVMDYWKYQWKRTGGWSHQSILGKLHSNLNEDALLYLYERTLRAIPLFENVENSFFRAFAKKLQEKYFMKGYMVVRSNEVIGDMYIIYRGKVHIMSDRNEVEACMGPGGIFGNITGASKYLTMSSIVASRNVDLLCIDGSEFYAILKSYPSVLVKVKYSVGQAARDYVLPATYTYPEAHADSESEQDESYSTFLYGSGSRSMNESHGSKSILSVRDGNNPYFIQAGHLIFKPQRWLRSGILPDSPLVIFMDYLTLILSYTDFMLIVYQMAFLSITYYLPVCIVIDLLFVYKLFLDIHTGYIDRYGDYVVEPRKVRAMYFSKRLFRRRDLLANLPLCYLAHFLPLRAPMRMAVFTYLRVPQLMRITNLLTYEQQRKITLGSANLFFKIISITLWASVLSHVMACLFFKLSCMTEVHCLQSNWMAKKELNLRVHYYHRNYFGIYIASLWYIINLLTITGTGDVTAQNDFEVIETIIIIIVIKFCAGLLISEISALISAHSSSRITYDYGISELRDGFRDMELSQHQINKMWDYVRELWNRQQGKQMPELLYNLPFRLRCEVMQALYGKHISESVIFRTVGDDFTRMLTMWMKHCVFFPGNYIVQNGDADQCMYFIHRGEVEVLTVHANLTESIYDVLGPEDSFGIAQGLYVGVAHHFSFRARTIVDVVYLHLDTWKYLLDFYPKSAKNVLRRVQNIYMAI